VLVGVDASIIGVDDGLEIIVAFDELVGVGWLVDCIFDGPVIIGRSTSKPNPRQ
jgi:hypothetical protein